jgi:beta-1,4-N-acetylglucosaminyltransferase
MIIARSDTWSLTKITEHFKNKMKHPVDLNKLGPKSNISIWRVFRAREVKQSYITSVFTTLIALVQSFFIALYCKVDLVVSNGPGTAMPLVFSNWLLSRLFGWKSQTLFIESFCRVTSLSLTGKLLLPICDK